MSAVAQPASPLSAGSLAQLTLSLVAIVALIFAISWALKRFRLAGPRGRGEITVLDELAVGPREKVMLIRVGDSQILVGVGTAGIVGLTPLSAPIAVTGSPSLPPFADRLREFMRRPGLPK
jgi:flagellar protein FliO/FliZ